MSPSVRTLILSSLGDLYESRDLLRRSDPDGLLPGIEESIANLEAALRRAS